MTSVTVILSVLYRSVTTPPRPPGDVGLFEISKGPSNKGGVALDLGTELN